MYPRPFFSLVIPCYNYGQYADGVYLDRLLQSVIEQKLDKSEIEIILADDHSPVSFNDIMQKYSDKLNMMHVVTECNFAPGNTRQCGSKYATGQWLCFADHDDTFYPNVLHYVKNVIELSHAFYVVYSDFDKVDEIDGHVVEEFRKGQLSTWVHGKFYNLDNFWRKYDLHFPKDLKTHEDIALGSQVNCILTYLNYPQLLHIDRPIYRWTDNSHSVSNTSYKDEEDVTFLEKAFSDFIESRTGVYLDECNRGHITQEDLLNLFMPEFYSSWLLINNWRVQNHTTYLHQNELILHNLFLRILSACNIDVSALKEHIITRYAKVSHEIDKQAEQFNVYGTCSWIDYIVALSDE